MKDKICKAKRVDNGEWICGYYVCLNEKSHRIYTGYAETDCGHYYPDFYEVVPETISKSTGLVDKNNEEIFEGDIVKTQPFYDRPYSKNKKSKQFIGVVEYKIRNFGGNNYYPEQNYHAEWGLKFYEDFGRHAHYAWGELWNCEIIGNVFDSPELLSD